MSADRWTSDALLTEQGVKTYSAQVRELFRRYADDFETLAREVRADLVADPIEGDNKLTARWHAWQVSGALRDMAKHARAVVAAGKALEGDYRRVCVELPVKRAAKAAAKELQKAGRSLPAGAVTNDVAAAAARRAMLPAQAGDHDDEQTAPVRPVTPWGDLFKEAR
ncbi:hypothetical protein ACFYRY_42010 [Streptomyces sp. NPDC005263]|uniref:hypothetical protein n=1 Tax=Streptomyces sp. NPDC005263 TaxID=3364711 RepID=UPI0036B8837D